MAREGKSFTITWKVENATFWWNRPTLKPSEILSPAFTVKAMRGMRWKLKLAPKTQNLRSQVAFSLLSETEDVDLKGMVLDLELSFLGSGGACLKSGEFTKIAFSNKTTSPPLMVERYRAFEQQMDLFLSQDTLIVRCRMWNTQGSQSESEECSARTRLEVQREIFDVTLGNFSALVNDQIRSLDIRAKSGQDPPFLMDIELSEQGFIYIEANVVDKTFTRPCICRLLLLNSAGNREKCGADKIWFDFESSVKIVLPEDLPMKKLTDNYNLHLPDDVLNLELEIIFPTGTKSEEIDKPEYELDSSPNISAISPEIENLNTPHAEEDRILLLSTLKNDLMSLHNDRMFCDTKLRTEAETFPAHKSVLSARSPVFKAMFTTDMKEKASDSVVIKDLSSDTVRKMLLFLYTDTVEDLDWESAQDLYIAADKYGIITLRQRCESYLKKNFCTSNVCEILILADMHENSDLKKTVQEYILEHEAEVFRSDEWKGFIGKYSLLAAETMYLKYR